MVIDMSETKTEQREATSIKIKPRVWKDAKIQAINEGKTVSELVEDAIEQWIKEHKKLEPVLDEETLRTAAHYAKKKVVT